MILALNFTDYAMLSAQQASGKCANPSTAIPRGDGLTTGQN